MSGHLQMGFRLVRPGCSVRNGRHRGWRFGRLDARDGPKEAAMRKYTGSRVLAILAAAVLALPGSLPAQVGVDTLRNVVLSQADSVSLSIAIFSAAVANGTSAAHGRSAPKIVCVSGLPIASPLGRVVLDSASARSSVQLLSRSACSRSDRNSLPRNTPEYFDAVTGNRGIAVNAGAPVFFADGTFSFYTGYAEHAKSAGAWNCSGRRQPTGWVVTECKLSWIT